MGMEIVYTCSTYVTWLYTYIYTYIHIHIDSGSGTTISRTLEGLVGLSRNFIPAPNPSQFNSPQDPWDEQYIYLHENH